MRLRLLFAFSLTQIVLSYPASAQGSSWSLRQVGLEESRALGPFKEALLNPEPHLNSRIAILGASGFLGKKLYRTFQQVFPHVVGTSFSTPGYVHLDVTSEDEVRGFVERFHPDVVIYAAGETNLDRVEADPERAEALNVKAIGLFGKYFKGHFVYFSSDYVFDGLSPPYSAGAIPRPLNLYGETKLRGEQLARSTFQRSAILRMGLLYGYNDPSDKPTAVRKIIEALDGGEALTLDNVQVRHPVLIDDVATKTLAIVQQGTSGIIQINGSESVTQFDLAQLIADAYFHLYPQSIGEQPAEAVKKRFTGRPMVDLRRRPLDAGLVVENEPTPLKIGLRKVIRRLSRRLKGGSYTRTFKFQRNDAWFVRKEAFQTGREKLANEIRWLQNLPAQARPRFPRVLSSATGGEMVFYEMPFFDWRTLTEWILDEGMNADAVRRKLEQVLRFYRDELMPHGQHAAPADYARNFLIRKIRDRIEETRRLAPEVFADLFQAEALIINGKAYKNVLPLIKEIEADDVLLAKLQPPVLTLIHGDLHLDNILADDGDFLLLDPRGDPAGDPLYDIAKLLHTIAGKYDILNYDLHHARLEKRDGQIVMSLVYPTDHPAWQTYRALESQLPEILQVFLGNDVASRDPYWLERLAFTHGALFASDMPFHLKGDGREERAIAIYATGVMLLNEFITLTRGETKDFLGFSVDRKTVFADKPAGLEEVQVPLRVVFEKKLAMSIAAAEAGVAAENRAVVLDTAGLEEFPGLISILQKFDRFAGRLILLGRSDLAEEVSRLKPKIRYVPERTPDAVIAVLGQMSGLEEVTFIGPSDHAHPVQVASAALGVSYAARHLSVRAILEGFGVAPELAGELSAGLEEVVGLSRGA